MPSVCPICKSRALELVRTGDATGFYCKVHGHFKIANTVALDDYYTRTEWEDASHPLFVFGRDSVMIRSGVEYAAE
jgi:hypothetical protein